MYTETQRIINHLAVDNTETESFTWSVDGGLTNTPEVQVVVQDTESPTGIWVYWQTSNEANNFDDFVAASFPRKPIKRGGTPPNP